MPRRFQNTITISICMPIDFVDEMDKFIKEQTDYNTRSEFLRHAVQKATGQQFGD